MELQITQEHINKGKPEDPNSCPIALALSERFGAFARASVGCAAARVEFPAAPPRFFDLSRQAMRFVGEFDHHGAVLPCTLTLIERS